MSELAGGELLSVKHHTEVEQIQIPRRSLLLGPEFEGPSGQGFETNLDHTFFEI